MEYLIIGLLLFINGNVESGQGNTGWALGSYILAAIVSILGTFLGAK